VKHVLTLRISERASQRFAISGKQATLTSVLWLGGLKPSPASESKLESERVEGSEDAAKSDGSGNGAKVREKIEKKVSVEQRPIDNFIKIISASEHGANGDEEEMEERVGAVLSAVVVNLCESEMDGGAHRKPQQVKKQMGRFLSLPS